MELALLTPEENALLTQVGPGTRMGDLLRRYWHPIAAVNEMRERWTKRVRIMGEDLVLFRDRSGTFGLIGEACPHRRASLAYGIPQADGIRCPYHGWKFDGSGRCLDQPNEPEGSTFKDKVSLAGYPVQELAGLLFAYLGPAPAPLMLKLDGFLASPAIRLIGKAVIPCNWLQIMENSADPIHSEWLHGHFQNFVEEGTGRRTISARRHLKIAFDEVPYGIIKRRLKEGQSEDCDDWQIGHPLVFPNILALGNVDRTWQTYEFQIRVPVDDTHTTHFWFTSFVPPASGVGLPAELLERAHVFDVPLDTGELDVSEFQDAMVWAAQGGVADRGLEHLGTTDRGITLYRRMLLRELERIADGHDPMLVNRDPLHDEVLDLPIERNRVHFSDGFATLYARRHWRYSGLGDQLLALFADKEPVAAT
jgi:5,5'-dehydrodivanillate O-demethylase oxygenase subunit